VLQKAKPIAKRCSVSFCNGGSNKRAEHGNCTVALALRMALSRPASSEGK
jgi:hypothetical protein